MQSPAEPSSKWPARVAWALAPVAVLLVLWALTEIHFRTGVSETSRSAPWSVPAWAFAVGFAPALVAVLAAPYGKLVTAVILSILIVFAANVFWVDFLSALGGALTLVACVEVWTRRPSERRPLAATASVFAIGCAATLGLGYGRFADRPALSDELPFDLAHAIGEDAGAVQGFYRYELSSFIDTQWLWRLDASDHVIQRVVERLELAPAPEVPERFWEMPPAYWPRARPAGSQAFRSAAFSATERGGDRLHYFLLHEPARSRAFLWVKDNF